MGRGSRPRNIRLGFRTIFTIIYEILTTWRTDRSILPTSPNIFEGETTRNMTWSKRFTATLILAATVGVLALAAGADWFGGSSAFTSGW